MTHKDVNFEKIFLFFLAAACRAWAWAGAGAGAGATGAQKLTEEDPSAVPMFVRTILQKIFSPSMGQNPVQKSPFGLV